MHPKPSDILHEDNHLLVVNKPAELPTMGAAEGEPSLVNWAKDYLKHKYNKPGNVYLGVVSRLDAFVTGAVVLARTSKAASRLTRQFQERTVNKTYWAIVAGRMPKERGQCISYLRKDDRHRQMVVCKESDQGAKEARLRYQVYGESDKHQWLQIELETGRKHQIRVQLAALGHPIVGDRKYGSQQEFSRGIALHAWQLELTHPTQNERQTFNAPIPSSWHRFPFGFDL